MAAAVAAAVAAVVAVAAAGAAAVAVEPDRVGIGWRRPLAAAIFAALDAIDVIEVIAETCEAVGAPERRSLRALGREVPLLLHGVSLGPASVSPVDEHRLDGIARVIGTIEPRTWSEHLSFVRSGGHEIGHLAAPPRNAATVDGALRNLGRITEVVGMHPALENIATLLQPPASSLDEPEWVAAIAAGAGAPLLLDLHNLYANAVNFGHEPRRYLERFPLQRVELVHISGGVWTPTPDGWGGRPAARLLDDHLHDVPDPVFELLEVVAAAVPGPLTVILERDGHFPPMPVLLGQLRRARSALAAGRCRAPRLPQRREAGLALRAT
jgi:uncharacterized protein